MAQRPIHTCAPAANTGASMVDLDLINRVDNLASVGEYIFVLADSADHLAASLHRAIKDSGSCVADAADWRTMIVFLELLRQQAEIITSVADDINKARRPERAS